jgi:uncharacterized protein YndB with AHSA1/START domain
MVERRVGGNSALVAENRVTIDARPEQVFAVLADPRSYEEWLVGCKHIRGVDGDWPEVGSVFHHRVGVGPLALEDNTKVLECSAPERLVLEARARPIGVAEVVFSLSPVAEGGTEVVMAEKPVRGLAKSIDNPLLGATVSARNGESLRRLKRYVERVSAER